MFKRLILIQAFIAMLAPPAMAQFVKPVELADTRDKQVMAGIEATVSDEDFSKLRGGGTSRKPLGQYMVEPNIEFNLDYQMVSADLQNKFAYDLHEFIKAKGVDWSTVRLHSANFTYVPYDKQHEFADSWWLRNYKSYKDGYLIREIFLYDAIVDATNVYGFYGRKAWSSADYIKFEDASLQEVLKKFWKNANFKPES